MLSAQDVKLLKAAALVGTAVAVVAYVKRREIGEGLTRLASELKPAAVVDRFGQEVTGDPGWSLGPAIYESPWAGMALGPLFGPAATAWKAWQLRREAEVTAATDPNARPVPEQRLVYDPVTGDMIPEGQAYPYGVAP